MNDIFPPSYENVIGLWLFLIFFLWVLQVFFSTSSSSSSQNQKQEKENVSSSWAHKVKKDLLRKLEKEKIMLEEMEIKTDEIESKIQKLSYTISNDFEDEEKNQSEIRRLQVSLRQAKVKIEEKEEIISWLEEEIWKIIL